jgi:hypothetical protein
LRFGDVSIYRYHIENQLFVSVGVKDVDYKKSNVNIDYLIVIVMLFSYGNVDFATTITLKVMDNYSDLI